MQPIWPGPLQSTGVLAEVHRPAAGRHPGVEEVLRDGGPHRLARRGGPAQRKVFVGIDVVPPEVVGGRQRREGGGDGVGRPVRGLQAVHAGYGGCAARGQIWSVGLGVPRGSIDLLPGAQREKRA